MIPKASYVLETFVDFFTIHINKMCPRMMLKAVTSVNQSVTTEAATSKTVCEECSDYHFDDSYTSVVTEVSD